VTAVQLLGELRVAGVELTAEGDRLHYRAPSGALTDDLRAAMRALKVELLALLELEVGARRPVPTSSEGDPFRQVGPGETLRIPLDDLVYGDFLERHKLRVVGGTAYPDGHTYRPTIYLADEA
jgi:hypothetical protein